jgi:hypothetical protein
MSRPFNLIHALPALTGIPPAHVADLVALRLAISDEADHVLASFPHISRNLSGTTISESVRCIGNMRGPIRWAETLTARANTFGADDIFVCAAPRRSTDTAENRVLVAALELIARAGRVTGSVAAQAFAPEDLARIEANATLARTLLRTPALAEVRRRPNRREVHKVATGRRGRQYRTALAMLDRRSEPLRSTELVRLCDPRTMAQHRALVLVMASLQRRGLAVPLFRCAKGELVAGGLRYRNWRRPTPAGNHGILVNQLLVDAPAERTPEARAAAIADLERRAGGRHFCLVDSPEEADLAVDLALAGTSSVPSLTVSTTPRS